jgi:hypothetical protein
MIIAGCGDRAATEKILFDFETEQDLDRVQWKCHALFSLLEEHSSHGAQCLRLELYPSSYPGLAPVVKEKDWSGFRSLCFEVYNPHEEEIQITVRIDDRKDWPDYSERYNKSFQLVGGSNRIEIPLSTLVTSGTRNQMDLKNIHRFLIFLVNPPQKKVLYVDYIRLVK